MLNTQRLLRIRGGIVGVVIFCALPGVSFGQFRPPRHDHNRLPGGKFNAPDPTDSQNKAKGAQQKASRYLREGRKYLSTGKIQQAKTKFKAAIGLVGLTGAGQSALSQLKTLHRRGMASLKEARSLYKTGQYTPALKQAKSIKGMYANLFGGIPVETDLPDIPRQAVQLAKKIETDPLAKIQFQEEKAGRRGKRLAHLERLSKKDHRRYLDLYKTLKSISKRYPDCPTGKRCHARLQELKADKKIWSAIKREQERRFILSTLNSAAQYEKAGLPKKAAEEYHKLEVRYPHKSRAELRTLAQK